MTDMNDAARTHGHIGRFHHIGIVTADIERACEQIRGLVGGTISDGGEDSRLSVKWTWIESPENPIIELLAPLSDEGPIARWLQRRGDGLHHVSFMPDDFDEALSHAHTCGDCVLHENRSDPEFEEFFIDPKRTAGALLHSFRFLNH